MMRYIRTSRVLRFLVILVLWAGLVFAENIDPNNDGSQYAYGENVGWLNFEPSQGPGVKVSDANLAGYVWAENIGWINLSPSMYGGVVNDGTGQLSGHAWGQNVGWINFRSTHGGVTIDADGNFDGWAWGENIGWIHFRSTVPVAYKVQTSWTTSCIVDLDDLGRFCKQWLESGPGLQADLDSGEDVNFTDYGKLAETWLKQCPIGWPLKE